jgi:ribosomal protein S18 acetylase RimI-like enzyme
VDGPLRPLSSDRDASRRLGREAITARVGGTGESERWARAFEERLEREQVNGRLYVAAGRPAGIVCWAPGGPVGIAVDLLYARDAARADPEVYSRILSELERLAGPIAFAPGPLEGLPPASEERLMRALGFRPFGRSEMVLQRASGPSEPPSPATDQLRPAGPADLAALAELHARAYHGRFDRLLFSELPDEREDALRGIRQLFEGRWGEFSPVGSWVIDRSGSLVAAVISVQGESGTLIADVMVDPDAQGQGLGRRVLARAIASLHAHGERPIRLNVTEGNTRAQRLYEGLGFVRSLGPTHDWYNAQRIPVPPGPG